MSDLESIHRGLDDLHITGRVVRERDHLRGQVRDLAEEVGDLRAIVAELTGPAVFEHTAAGNWSALISDGELTNFRERAGLEPRAAK